MRLLKLVLKEKRNALSRRPLNAEYVIATTSRSIRLLNMRGTSAWVRDSAPWVSISVKYCYIDIPQYMARRSTVLLREARSWWRWGKAGWRRSRSCMSKQICFTSMTDTIYTGTRNCYSASQWCPGEDRRWGSGEWRWGAKENGKWWPTLRPLENIMSGFA